LKTAQTNLNNDNKELENKRVELELKCTELETVRSGHHVELRNKTTEFDKVRTKLQEKLNEAISENCSILETIEGLKRELTSVKEREKEKRLALEKRIAAWETENLSKKWKTRKEAVDHGRTNVSGPSGEQVLSYDTLDSTLVLSGGKSEMRNIKQRNHLLGSGVHQGGVVVLKHERSLTSDEKCLDSDEGSDSDDDDESFITATSDVVADLSETSEIDTTMSAGLDPVSQIIPDDIHSNVNPVTLPNETPSTNMTETSDSVCIPQDVDSLLTLSAGYTASHDVGQPDDNVINPCVDNDAINPCQENDVAPESTETEDSKTVNDSAVDNSAKLFVVGSDEVIPQQLEEVNQSELESSEQVSNLGLEFSSSNTIEHSSGDASLRVEPISSGGEVQKESSSTLDVDNVSDGSHETERVNSLSPVTSESEHLSLITKSNSSHVFTVTSGGRLVLLDDSDDVINNGGHDDVINSSVFSNYNVTPPVEERVNVEPVEEKPVVKRSAYQPRFIQISSDDSDPLTSPTAVSSQIPTTPPYVNGGSGMIGGVDKGISRAEDRRTAGYDATTKKTGDWSEKGSMVHAPSDEVIVT